MGTTWRAKMCISNSADIGALESGIERVLGQVIAEMSQWRPDSDLSRFNASPAGTWHRLPDGFFKVLSNALKWAERTGGAYDPTVGAVVDLWGFGSLGIVPGMPDLSALNRACREIGWRRVILNVENQRAFQPGRLRLDLSAIAKGYAVDQVADFLRGAGVENFLVEIGGELRGEGLKPDGTPWWVKFEQPRSGCGVESTCPETVLALSGFSIATSGDERRFFELDGRRYAHTLDPQTGSPLSHELISVTVVAPDCMTADVLATALYVLGPQSGPEFAAEHGYAVRFVRYDSGRLAEQLSPALADMLC